MNKYLDTKLTDLDFVAFDFETTGLSAYRDRVVEIGAVRFQLNNAPKKHYSQLINPEQLIPDEVIKIHGIDNQEVARAPVWSAKADEILEFLEGAVLMAHHASFDVAFLVCEMQRMARTPPKTIVLDSYHLARKRQPKAPSYKLSHLIEFLELKMQGQAHRALPDSLACAALFERCVQSITNWQDLSLGDLLKTYPQIRVDLQPDQYDQNPLQQTLKHTIEKQEDLLISYTNARSETLERQITPLLMGGYGDYAYVEAFCHLREQNRQFRLNRIKLVSQEHNSA